MAGSGGGIGLLLGGVLTGYLSWRWTMYANVAIAGVALVGALLMLPRSSRTSGPSFDVLGTLLASSGLFAVVYGLSDAETYGWTSPRCWALLLVGLALLGAFTWWQNKTAQPLLPLRVLRDRLRGGAFVSILLVGAGMFAIFLFLTYFLQDIQGYSPVRTGFALLPMTLGIMAVLAMVWLTHIGLSTDYATDVLPPLVVAGLGLGCVLPPAMSLGTYGVAAPDAGVASATVNTMQQIGGSIGTALLNTIAATATATFLATHNTSDRTVDAQASIHGYVTVYWWAAGIFALGAVAAAVLLPRRRTSDRS